MANKIIKEANKNVVETMQALMATANMNLGIEEIEFPDGSKEKFFYNGEADRQAAIDFATICVNSTDTVPEAKRRMFTCFNLLVNGIKPVKIIEKDGYELYLDGEKKALYNAYGEAVIELSEEEKALEMNLDVLELLLENKLEAKIAADAARAAAYCENEEDEDCEW